MFKLLGCRGTNGVFGEKFNRYSSYTSSIFIKDNCRAFILDMGTGILNLNAVDLSNIKEYHIFFSHLHWDHLMGIFAFKPFFLKDVSVSFYLSERYGFKTYRGFLSSIFKTPFYPIKYNIFSANIKLFPLSDEVCLDFDNLSISSVKGNHPDFALVYRLDFKNGKSVVYATDYENSFDADLRIISFCKNVDYLIYDTTYLPGDYTGKLDGISKVGWGHSTYEKGCEIARLASVKNFILFHHNPEYEDTVLEEILLKSMKLFSNSIIAKDSHTLF